MLTLPNCGTFLFESLDLETHSSQWQGEQKVLYVENNPTELYVWQIYPHLTLMKITFQIIINKLSFRLIKYQIVILNFD